MTIKIALAEFYDSFSQSLGMAGAKIVVNEAISRAGLQIDDDYPLVDALKICDRLKDKTGLVRILAGCLAANFQQRSSPPADSE